MAKLKIAWAWLKKYGAYILVPVVGILGYVLYKLFAYKPQPAVADFGNVKLRKHIHETREKINEVRTRAAIEIALARKEEASVKEELNTVVKIKDPVKRRDRLIALYNRLDLDE
jgi:hypothetical protein